MNKGFTLLEMVIVVSVLSILFLLAIPNIQTVMNMIENKGCDAQVKVVDTAIIEFKLIYGDYPKSVNDLINAGLITQKQQKCPDNTNISISNNQAYVR